jgi:hypothetical protein
MAEGTRGDFSGKDGAMLYATARYLCFYLQERGLLRRFYRAFRARSSKDSRGLATLQDTTGRDLGALRTDWERFVAELREGRDAPIGVETTRINPGLSIHE